MGGETHEPAVAIAYVRAEWPGAQQLQRRSDMLERVSGDRPAIGSALAGVVELSAHRGRIVRIPGIVRTVQRIGSIEHQGAQPVRMAQRKDLRDVAPSRIAVQT